MRPALPTTYEALFHNTGIPSELASHYFYASLPSQFDAVIHFDQPRAVEALERTSEWGIGEPAETFPSGM